MIGAGIHAKGHIIIFIFKPELWHSVVTVIIASARLTIRCGGERVGNNNLFFVIIYFSIEPSKRINININTDNAVYFCSHRLHQQ